MKPDPLDRNEVKRYWVCQNCKETFLEPYDFIEVLNKEEFYPCPICRENSKWDIAPETIKEIEKNMHNFLCYGSRCTIKGDANIEDCQYFNKCKCQIMTKQENEEGN